MYISASAWKMLLPELFTQSTEPEGKDFSFFSVARCCENFSVVNTL
jgi:hypothetical protein